jgi:hypothetical protein
VVWNYDMEASLVIAPLAAVNLRAFGISDGDLERLSVWIEMDRVRLNIEEDCLFHTHESLFSCETGGRATWQLWAPDRPLSRFLILLKIAGKSR